MKEDGKLDLDIWMFEEIKNDDQSYYVETIEAEIAYLIRNTDGQWPKHQNEIHFHESDSEHRRLALKIVNSIKNRE